MARSPMAREFTFSKICSGPDHPACPGDGMTIKIILADHHQKIRRDLVLLLAGEADMQVVGEAADCGTTIRIIQEHSAQILIMDIALPGSNGVVATHQIVAKYPLIKIIALSMHSDSLFVLSMLKAGASGYLLKDCALEELVGAIRTVVTGKVYLSASLSHMLVKDLANKHLLTTGKHEPEVR
jgi:two-component system, NarL family, response regulator NreC